MAGATPIGRWTRRGENLAALALLAHCEATDALQTPFTCRPPGGPRAYPYLGPVVGLATGHEIPRTKMRKGRAGSPPSWVGTGAESRCLLRGPGKLDTFVDHLTEAISGAEDSHGSTMANEGYPNLLDVQSYLEGLMGRNEAKRHRHLAWLGSSVTAIAVLSWLAIDIFERSPEMWSVNAVLALVSLVLMMLVTTDSLLPGGLSGLFRQVLTPWAADPNQLEMLTMMIDNIRLVRERAVLAQVWAVFSNLPLFAIFLLSGPAQASAGAVALTIALVRSVLALGLLAFFLEIGHVDRLKSYRKSIREAEAQLSSSTRLLLFFYKLSQFQKVLSASLKLVFYGILVVSVSWVVVQFGPPWVALRLAFLSFAVGILGSFAFFTWEQTTWLGEENAAWGGIRKDILFGKLKSPQDATSEMREAAKEIAKWRAFPYKVRYKD